MRPGPGLVVMALAFISGAQRGTSQQSTPIIGRNPDLAKTDKTGFLAEINPWLSACDLANPKTAPDLQGQCSESGSILPKNWVNESPGPPVCPKPCIETYKTNFVSKTDSNLNMEEINRFYEKQQCLDYLGDEKASSPEQICKKSSREISNKLRILRLTHCCERNVYSSLHNEGMTAVTNGGKGCEQVLQKLIDTDALAGRITCGLNEILFRYDCRQVYSIKHQCTGCKEAYRRWVCSTLVPFFAEPNDIRQNRNEETSSSNNNINNKFDHNSKIPLHSLHGDGEREISQAGLVPDPLVNKMLNRSKRKSELMRRKKIRPCLKVCQSVEEHCPYMLPGDRAPGYNTQYAGEPTFLCKDPNIPETGEQLAKSNNGPDTCCYRYCSAISVYHGICAYCDSNINDSAKSTQLHSESERDEYSISNVELPPQSCQLVPGLSLTTSRCEIPYYASSPTTSAAASSCYNVTSTKNKQLHFIWTISWTLLIMMLITKNYIVVWTNYYLVRNVEL